MSDYTIAVPWSGKDALSDSDSAKVISGDDFNTEFTTVRTAVNSKADLNGDASEDFSAATQSQSDNSNKVATTAYVDAASGSLNAAAYPVGAIFTTTTVYADSAAVVAAVGGTTWAAFGAGKVLVGLDSSDTDFDTIEETGGAKTVSAGTSGSTTLSTSQIPSHTHTLSSLGTNASGGVATTHGHSAGGGSHTTDATGGGSGHTHTTPGHSLVQPYIVVYFWKRTA